MKKLLILLCFLPLVSFGNDNGYIFVNINDGVHDLGKFDGKTPIIFCATEYIPTNEASPIECKVTTGIPLSYTGCFNLVDMEVKSNGKLLKYDSSLAKIITFTAPNKSTFGSPYKNNVQLCIRIRSRFDSNPNPIPNTNDATIECKSIFNIIKPVASLPLYHPF